jgi:uncharacterized membrane protein (UPF0127 family)
LTTKRLFRIISNIKKTRILFKIELKKAKTKPLELLIPIFFTAVLSACAQTAHQEDVKTLCIKDICIQAEIVSSFAARELGLMFRESLADDRGMLFIFEEEGSHGFWMKNMRFPLDIIWLNSNKKIVDIKENIFPCGQSCEILTPKTKAKYVLEVNAGFVQRNKIKIGELVRF